MRLVKVAQGAALYDPRMRQAELLFFVRANKSRPFGQWSEDDYDVRDDARDGPVIGRIYKLSVAPTGNWWFWALNLFPAVAGDSGTAETREVAMAAFEAQWRRCKSKRA